MSNVGVLSELLFAANGLSTANIILIVFTMVTVMAPESLEVMTLRGQIQIFPELVESLEKAKSPCQRERTVPLLALCDTPCDPSREDVSGGPPEMVLGEAFQISGVQNVSKIKKRQREEEVCTALRGFQKLVRLQKEEAEILEFEYSFEEDLTYY